MTEYFLLLCVVLVNDNKTMLPSDSSSTCHGLSWEVKGKLNKIDSFHRLPTAMFLLLEVLFLGSHCHCNKNWSEVRAGPGDILISL